MFVPRQGANNSVLHDIHQAIKIHKFDCSFKGLYMGAARMRWLVKNAGMIGVRDTSGDVLMTNDQIPKPKSQSNPNEQAPSPNSQFFFRSQLPFLEFGHWDLGFDWDLGTWSLGFGDCLSSFMCKAP